MLISRFVAWMFSVAMMVLGAGIVSGQPYPNKPIRIVAPPVGGSSDFAARIIAQGLTASLRQQVIVDNRSTLIAMETVAKAPPDGYTLLALGNPLWILPLMRNVSVDPVRDFSPISLVTRSPSLLVVHPSTGVKSVKELIALAKAKPGELNYSTSGTGGSTHLAGELFKAMAGVNIVNVNYKGSGAAINDLIGGQVQLMFPGAASVASHVKSGRLRALAVTTAQQSALAPGLPTVAESGVPGYESVSIIGIFTPAGTSTAPINFLNQETLRFLKQEDVKERFFNSGVEIVGSSPEELATAVKSEITRLGKIIKDAGIRAE